VECSVNVILNIFINLNWKLLITRRELNKSGGDEKEGREAPKNEIDCEVCLIGYVDEGRPLSNYF